ncbi:Cardiolipin synthase C [Pandoraea communis]|uniref:Cardiolipin synthase C n=1 Tax=Pandoraea communis TaxID=2508297 RepID=A0A5E4T4R1_9BURK|nr:Cardiolipin synthase C [Pandoraea communis]
MFLSRVFRSYRRCLLPWRRLTFLPLALFVVACSSVRPPPLPSQRTSHTPAAESPRNGKRPLF